MKLEPIFDRIILKRIKENEQKTKNGFFLPTTLKEEPCRGEVISITEKETNNCNIKIGDFVLYPIYNAIQFNFENQAYDIIKSCDILCKINKGDERNDKE